jgi:hypothetical protein
MRFLLLVALLALCAFLPPSAGAAPFGEAEQNALARAASYWGRAPLQCAVVIGEVVPVGSLAHPEATGEATMPPPTGEVIDCRIWIVEDLTPPMLCLTMRHEYGHLLGFDHDDPEMGDEVLACSSVQNEAASMRRMLQRQRRRCEKLRRQNAPRIQKRICWDNWSYMQEQLRKAEADLPPTS